MHSFCHTEGPISIRLEQVNIIIVIWWIALKILFLSLFLSWIQREVIRVRLGRIDGCSSTTIQSYTHFPAFIVMDVVHIIQSAFFSLHSKSYCLCCCSFAASLVMLTRYRYIMSNTQKETGMQFKNPKNPKEQHENYWQFLFCKSFLQSNSLCWGTNTIETNISLADIKYFALNVLKTNVLCSCVLCSLLFTWGV